MSFWKVSGSQDKRRPDKSDRPRSRKRNGNGNSLLSHTRRAARGRHSTCRYKALHFNERRRETYTFGKPVILKPKLITIFRSFLRMNANSKKMFLRTIGASILPYNTNIQKHRQFRLFHCYAMVYMIYNIWYIIYMVYIWYIIYLMGRKHCAKCHT